MLATNERDEQLLRRRPRDFAEVVRQRELGVADYVTNGDFLDAFYRAQPEERQRFLDIEPPVTDCPTVTKHSLALFAATAEKLAHDFALQVPEWVEGQRYFLVEPDIAGYRRDQIPEKFFEVMVEESPKEFARRNLFVSSNLLTRM